MQELLKFKEAQDKYLNDQTDLTEEDFEYHERLTREIENFLTTGILGGD